jgi:hypothetical protein
LERDAFFIRHPFSRFLIGAYIVSFSILVGVLYMNAQYKQLIADVLSSEGVPNETIVRVLTKF